MAFVPLKDFLSIWHFKLIGLICLRAVGERVKEPSPLTLKNKIPAVQCKRKAFL
jgi:hypothetical protein